MDEDQIPDPQPETITVELPDADLAIANASRLLYNAETQLDHNLMDKLTGMANAWSEIAAIQAQRHER